MIQPRFKMIVCAIAVCLAAISCTHSDDGASSSEPTTRIAPRSSSAVTTAPGTDDDKPIDFVLSCNGGGQVCDTVVLIPVTVVTDIGSASLVITRGTGHCASAAYTVSLDGDDVGTTPFTGHAGDTLGLPDTVTLDLGELDAGDHEIRIGGMGKEGGCNGGEIGSFGATVELPDGVRQNGTTSVEALE